MTQAALQLDYAKTPRWHRRSRFHLLLIGSMLLPIVLAAWKWGPQKLELAKMRYWQYRLMHYSPPPDQIVFDQDPAGRSTLLDGRGGYVPKIEYGFRDAPLTAVTRVSEIPDYFVNFFGGQTPNTPTLIVFMHERIAPSGYHYLIIVHGIDLFGTLFKIGQLPVEASTFKLGDWQNFPESSDLWSVCDGSWSPPIAKRLRIYAGQIDPADDSHFTVRYEQDGRTGLIDGFVDDFSTGLNPMIGPPRIARVRLSERFMRVGRQ